MKKADLINVVAAEAGVTKKAAGVAVNSVFNAITGAVGAGDKVAIAGFGTFEGKLRAARAGRNPQTGETITIPERTAVVFKAGKGLKDAANE